MQSDLFVLQQQCKAIDYWRRFFVYLLYKYVISKNTDIITEQSKLRENKLVRLETKASERK